MKNNKVEESIIKTSSYTANFPEDSCKVKVAVKKHLDWSSRNSFKTQIFENAIYEGGFVSIDGDNNYYLGSNFLFHKLKRTKI